MNHRKTSLNFGSIHFGKLFFIVFSVEGSLEIGMATRGRGQTSDTSGAT